MENIIKLDVLGREPSIFYFSKSRYKTLFGSFLSVSVISMTISLLAYFLYRVFTRSNIWVVESRGHSEEEFIDYSPYQQAMLVTDTKGNLFSEEAEAKLFGLYFVYFYLEDDNSTKQSYKFYRTEQCTEEHFKDNWDLVKDTPNIERYKCVPNDAEIDLFGVYGGKKKFSFTYFFVSRCEVGVRGATECFPRAEIDAKMDDFYVNMLFIDYNLQNNNLSEPGQKYAKNERIQVGIKMFKRLFFELSLVDYTTDTGYIFEANKVETMFVMGKGALVPDIKENEYYFATTVSLSRTKITIHRSFEKLQQVLSNLGGTVKALTLGAQFLLYFCYDGFYFESLFPALGKVKTDMAEVIRTNQSKSNASFNQQKKVSLVGLSLVESIKVGLGLKLRSSLFSKNLVSLKKHLSLDKILKMVVKREEEATEGSRIEQHGFRRNR